MSNKKKLHVANSPLTNTIYCGSVSKDGKRWLSDKTDVTSEACAAVAMHVLQHGEPVVVKRDGIPMYEIQVDECGEELTDCVEAFMQPPTRLTADILNAVLAAGAASLDPVQYDALHRELQALADCRALTLATPYDERQTVKYREGED